MLVLKRKSGQSIVILTDGKRIEIEVATATKLRCRADESVRIVRKEIEGKQRQAA